MIELTLEMAETAVRAAQAKARALRAPMTVTVVDEAGRLVLSARGDGTGFFSTETSRAKAMAAASFRKRTAELADLVAKGGFWAVVPTVLQGQILPTLGGAPITPEIWSDVSRTAIARARSAAGKNRGIELA